VKQRKFIGVAYAMIRKWKEKKLCVKACTTLDNKIKAFAQKHPKAAGVYFEKVAKETGKLSRGRYMAKPLTPSPKKLATSIS